jgi:hypothetical protein
MGTLAKHVHAADHAKKNLSEIAEGLAARSRAAWKSLTERPVRSAQGLAWLLTLLSALTSLAPPPRLQIPTHASPSTET